jgi:hypothetical protein
MAAKTLPDQSRYTYVYHPSREHKERWKKIAAKARIPLSKFIIATVDGVVDENEEYKPRRELAAEVETLRQENIGLREDLHRKDIILSRYEVELKRYRAAPWIEDTPGIAQMNEDLIKILKARGSIEGGQLLEELGIDRREKDLAKAIHKQLESLMAFGAVKQDNGSWTWLW